eukprot:403332624
MQTSIKSNTQSQLSIQNKYISRHTSSPIKLNKNFNSQLFYNSNNARISQITPINKSKQLKRKFSEALVKQKSLQSVLFGLDEPNEYEENEDSSDLDKELLSEDLAEESSVLQNTIYQTEDLTPSQQIQEGISDLKVYSPDIANFKASQKSYELLYGSQLLNSSKRLFQQNLNCQDGHTRTIECQGSRNLINQSSPFYIQKQKNNYINQASNYKNSNFSSTPNIESDDNSVFKSPETKRQKTQSTYKQLENSPYSQSKTMSQNKLRIQLFTTPNSDQRYLNQSVDEKIQEFDMTNDDQIQILTQTAKKERLQFQKSENQRKGSQQNFMFKPQSLVPNTQQKIKLPSLLLMRTQSSKPASNTFGGFSSLGFLFNNSNQNHRSDQLDAQKSVKLSLQDPIIICKSLYMNPTLDLHLTSKLSTKSPLSMQITPDTLHKLILEPSRPFQIIDCRFDYEFQGGHIKGALNINTQDRMIDHFFQSKQNIEKFMREKYQIIFHCEFSQIRGPNMYSKMRDHDRNLHKSIPGDLLFYKEIYVLEGGFKNFYQKYPELCNGNYTPMKDEENKLKGKALFEECRQTSNLKLQRHQSFIEPSQKLLDNFSSNRNSDINESQQSNFN